jgi:hypothetical protein
MKKLFFIFGIVIVVLVAVITLNSCDQALTRSMGGTTKVQLEPGEKLLEVTWKGDNIWYLVEPMDTDYVPKTKTFKESSRAGILEGKVIFIETR